jgi:hypothetical protein
MKYIKITIIFCLHFATFTSLNCQQYQSNDWIETIEVAKWASYDVNVNSIVSEAQKSSKLFEILIVREYSTTNAYNNLLRDFNMQYDSIKQNEKKSIPDLRYLCLPLFNVNKFGIKIIQPSEVTTFRCSFSVNEKKFNSSGRSNIILSIKTNDSLLNKSLTELDLVKKRINNETNYYEFGGVKNEEDFCWKLQQLIYFLNELPEPETKELKLSRSSIQIDMGFGSNLSNSVQKKNYNSSYDGSQYSLESLSAFNFTLLKRIGQESITNEALSENNTIKKVTRFNPLRISLGFQYSYVRQLISGNIETFTDRLVNAGNIDGINQLNIYGSNINERFTISNHRIGAELRIEKETNTPYKDGITYKSFGFSFIPYSVIGSYFDANLISGEFSYKGKVDGVAGEIENIESLGLQNNVTLNKNRSSSGLFSGMGATLRLLFSFGTDKVGFCLFPYLSVESLKNNKDQSADYLMSRGVNDYNPSLFNLQRIQTTSFGLGFALQFPIGS